MAAEASVRRGGPAQILDAALEAIPQSMLTARMRLSMVTAYADRVEARDKICRAIQYGSKFVSAGEPGIAKDVERSTGAARKVFRLMKCLNELEAFFTPSPIGRQVSISFLLLKSKHLLLATYLAFDHCVWAGTVGIYKNKRRTDLFSRISMFCFLGGSACSFTLEIFKLVMKKNKKVSELDVDGRAPYEGVLMAVKYSLDTVLAIGLLQLASKKVTPRVAGAAGFISSLITCYIELYRLTPAKGKST